MATAKALVASVVLLLVLPGVALAQGSSAQGSSKGGSKPAPERECPHAFSDREAIVKTMAEAPTCAESLEIFQACASGASGDAGLGEAAVERCEKDFAGKLSPAQQRAYDAARKRCDRKYARKEGSMYISFTAYCHAEAALAVSRRHGARKPKR